MWFKIFLLGEIFIQRFISGLVLQTNLHIQTGYQHNFSTSCRSQLQMHITFDICLFSDYNLKFQNKQVKQVAKLSVEN